MINIRKLESDLWESADLLRAGSKLTSNQYCMPVLGLIFLRYAYSRFKLVEAEILKNRPVRNGRVIPVEASDFTSKSALFLPKEAQYEYLVNLPADIASAGLTNQSGHTMNSLGEVVNNAMELVETQSEQLIGVLPKDYTMFSDELLAELLRIFNNSALDEVGGDIIGRIYEYFLNKFAKNIAQDDGVFFTPKSLVKMIVNVLEPTGGILLDPACGSGGMFVQTGDFVNAAGMEANSAMTFYGQEKVEYNAQLCLMNMAVHGLNGIIRSGDEANTFYHDAHNLDGCCDYVMANPPFNVDKVNSESAQSAGRLPFGLPSINAKKEFGNANYLWISYFYSYLNEHGRAGFVMASSATDSSGKDRDIRQKLVETGHVDVMVSVGNNIPFCFERNIALLHPNNRVIPKYLYYAVNNPIFYGNANNIANGSAQKLIPLSKLAGMEISVPPIERQETIVNILSAYDDLIENNQKQIKLLEEAAQRLYKEWFIDLCFPGHETTPIVDGVPEGWEHKTFAQIADVVMGQSPKSEFYNQEERGLPFHQGVGSYGTRFVIDGRTDKSVTTGIGDEICNSNAIEFEYAF